MPNIENEVVRGILRNYGDRLKNETGGISAVKFHDAFSATLTNSLYEREDVFLHYHDSAYPLVRYSSPDIHKGDKVIIITSLFHANEIQSLFFWLDYGYWVFDTAREHGIKIIAYPLINADGAARLGRNSNQRYGREDGGSFGNNSFIGYIQGGKIIDDLGPDKKYQRTIWIDEVQPQVMPRETRAMIDFVRSDIAMGLDIQSVLDLHMDVNDYRLNDICTISPVNNPKQVTTLVGPAFYYYSFEKNKIFRDLVRYIEQEIGVPAIRSSILNSKEFIKNQILDITDAYGGIFRNDGSLPAAYYEFGKAKHALTVEVFQDVVLEKGIMVYRSFIENAIHWAAAS